MALPIFLFSFIHTHFSACFKKIDSGHPTKKLHGKKVTVKY